VKFAMIGVMIIGIVTGFPATAEEKPAPATYSKQGVLQEVEQFFGAEAEELADVVSQAFNDQGEPNALIAGYEVAAALGVGVRYGKGKLQTKQGYQRHVYWQGPSIGIDAGADVAKVLVLVYQLTDPVDIFQRFPGVEGSLYLVGGVGMNYLRSDSIVVTPIRFGAGWRQGVNVGYMDFTREPSVNPLWTVCRARS